MKGSNDSRTRWVSLAFVAALALGGGRVKADFTFGLPVNLGPSDGAIAKAGGFAQLTAAGRDGAAGFARLTVDARDEAEDSHTWR